MSISFEKTTSASTQLHVKGRPPTSG